jgi:hypothetical protein
MATKIKRSLWKTFINTTPSIAATWVLINPGVTSAKIGMNPKTTEETYIHEDSASISVDSYAPNLPIEGSVTNAEAAFEYLDAFRKTRAVLASAETEIVNVWLYKPDAAGLYLAEKQNVSIQIDKFGGEGGKAVKLNYTINFLGDPEVGTFDPVGLAFVETDATALLSSIVVASIDLVPQFKNKRIWYEAATDDATNTITCVAEDVAGTTIAIDLNDGTPVVNGAAASWVSGENVVIITVTHTADVALYYLFVTYTPA